MATRIVEQNLRWCEDKILKFLVQNGYTITTSGGDERRIQGKYTRADGKRMLLIPRIKVDLAAISSQIVRVQVCYGLNFAVFAIVGFAWLVIGFAPFLIMLKVTSHGSDLHPLWVILGWIAIACWMLYSLLLRLALGIGNLDEHQNKTEERLWQHLDPENLHSHETDSASQTLRTVFSFCKWMSPCFVILGVGFMVDSYSDQERYGAYLVMALGVILFILFGWMTCSLALPHRFHWKLRFYNSYMCWVVVVSAPCMMIFSYGLDPALLSGFGLQDAMMCIVFCLQMLMLQLVLRMLPEFRNQEKARIYYSPPSTRYEVLSKHNVTKDARRLLKRQRVWTWASFVLFTTLFYAAAAYLVIILVESAGGILGVRWALARSSHWALLIDLEGRPAAIEAFLLTCIIAAPMLFSVVQEVQAFRKSRRTWTFAEKLSLGLTDAHLPFCPLACMRDRLETDMIFVVELPDPLVNIRLGKRGFLSRKYFLGVSLGARNTLSQSEMEALLWHECGHAEIIGHSRWRDITAALSPWGLRFLDLLEDYYENERDSDLLAVKTMGNIEPLKSALRKISSQYKNLPKKGPERGIRTLRDGFELLKIVWDLDWKGYSHPDVDQRLRWLEEWEKQTEFGSC